ncbi:MAG: DNA polymerase I [Lachnospiraceae bacterium]|nr:DNA polymerase I [Lachnospiraceae bacterium]
MMNDYLLIIDGSSLLSTQYYGNLPKDILYAKTDEEKEALYHKIMHNSNGVYTNAVYGFMKTLLSIIKGQKPKYLAVCWDITRDTFRRELYSEYKGNRSSTPLPLKEQFDLCQKICDEIGIKQFASKEYEADDYAGSISNKFKNDIDVIVMTKDRDYLQLVDDKVSLWMMTSSASKAQDFVKRHSLSKDDYIAPDQALFLTPDLVYEEYGYTPAKTVMVKSLAGDSADNIPGVKGVGDKIAIKLASLYDDTKDLYDDIRDLDDAGIEEVKKRWKEAGLTRAPFKALLAKSDDELVGEESAMLSYKLATIKRDLDITESLDDLELKLSAEGIDKVFNELEFHSLSVNGIDAKYLDSKLTARIECEVINADKSRLDEYLNNAYKADIVGLDIIANKRDINQSAKQLSFDDLFSAPENTNSKELSKHPLDIDKYEIESLAFSYEEAKTVCIDNNNYSDEELKEILASIMTKSKALVVYDIKQILYLLSHDLRNELFIKSLDKELEIFDLSLCAYLINPLKSSYPYDEIVYDYKSALKDVDKAFSLCELYTVLRDELVNNKLLDLYLDIELPTAFVLYDLEYQGVIVDREKLKEYGDSLTEGINNYEKSIYEKAGHEFNIQSPKQLGEVLFEELKLPKAKKTKRGYSTSAEVLEGLKNDYPIVADVLEYRKLTKLHSTYAIGLSNFILSDGRIHGHFNQTVTATGRISSTEPNLQNIPMRTELGRAIRKVFLPKEGCKFIDADYSQIELRILAHISNDEHLISAYKEGKDIHSSTASRVFNIDYDKVTEGDRRNAKAVNFGIVYGISAHGLAEDLKITRAKAKEFIEQYYQTYPKIKNYLDKEVDTAYKTGIVTTLYGRIRPIPEIRSSNFNMRNFGERVAMNSPIQGTAADIMKLAMIRTAKGLLDKGLKSRMVLTIHDEIVIEAYEDELDLVKEVLVNAMTHAADLSVDLEISLSVGDTWYESK